MSLYYKSTEIREIDDALYADWIVAENPKGTAWQPLPEPPAYDPATHHAPQWDGAQWVESPFSIDDQHAQWSARAKEIGTRDARATLAEPTTDDNIAAKLAALQFIQEV